MNQHDIFTGSRHGGREGEREAGSDQGSREVVWDGQWRYESNTGEVLHILLCISFSIILLHLYSGLNRPTKAGKLLCVWDGSLFVHIQYTAHIRQAGIYTIYFKSVRVFFQPSFFLSNSTPTCKPNSTSVGWSRS